jgi:hypothetical protein
VSPRASTKTRNHRIIEVMAVLLLGVATIGSAWCGYQATRWNGEEGDLSRQASDLQVEAARQFGLATQTVSYDSSIVAQYAQAVSAGNEGLQAFIRNALVRPAFLPLLDEWRAQVAAGETPTNLLSNQEYLDTQLGGYRATEVAAAAKTTASVDAGENAEAYVLTTLLLASALFFAGVTTSFRVRFAQVLLLFGATLMIGYAASRLVDLPVA